jgi:sorting nexin-8
MLTVDKIESPHYEPASPDEDFTGQREPLSRSASNHTNTSAPVSIEQNQESPAANTENPSGGWGSYDDTTANFPSSFPATPEPTSTAHDSGLGGDGFAETEEPRRAVPGVRSIGGGMVTGTGLQENVTVTTLPEKEGMFMFQHRNYQVISTRRGNKVVRRYSDFVWLLDSLHKIYPFRQLPLLPPKRIGGKFLSWVKIIAAAADTYQSMANI